MGGEGPAQRKAFDKPLTVTILAMGGQGGGTLCDWIVAAAEHEGWIAQSTSVPGVAQRTGATIYYIEMLPPQDGQTPVLSLLPTPGDVDVVIAAELMEAGRSILRGFVTPDRTVLIASTHRSFTIGEKQRPGDGPANPVPVFDAVDFAARRAIVFDMQALADANGTVISAPLLGALAGAEVLPFPRTAFESALRGSKRALAANLKAFSAAFDRARTAPPPQAEASRDGLVDPPRRVANANLNRLLEQLHNQFPAVTRPMLFAGIKRLVDYQDAAYGDAYLRKVADIFHMDESLGGGQRAYAFTVAAAKYIAIAMAYDDVIRVADLKVRGERFARIRSELRVEDRQVLHLTEFMHPRIQEAVGTLPAAIGRFLEARPSLLARADKVINRGRRVRTGTIFWFVALYLLSALKPLRRRLLRHEYEMAHIERWLTLSKTTALSDYELAVEILGCRRLIKGYSDTHARGLSKFDRVLAKVPELIGKPDGAGWLRRLRTAALADEEGTMLDGALQTLETAFA